MKVVRPDRADADSPAGAAEISDREWLYPPHGSRDLLLSGFD
jgi:hypothetical protein